jgi:hypothetical protein
LKNSPTAGFEDAIRMGDLALKVAFSPNGFISNGSDHENPRVTMDIKSRNVTTKICCHLKSKF